MNGCKMYCKSKVSNAFFESERVPHYIFLYISLTNQIEKALKTRKLGAVSQKLLGGKLAPKLVYFIPRKELLTLSEMTP